MGHVNVLSTIHRALVWYVPQIWTDAVNLVYHIFHNHSMIQLNTVSNGLCWSSEITVTLVF